ncbi:MAG TPA: hypothetical protein GX694_11570 [Actinomycetales bacterium]|nr:hypothetical protein [Actinomycetales bacterium]
MSAESHPGWEAAPDLFDDVAAAIAAAEGAVRPAERYLAAHRAALRVAAGVLARRRPRLRERRSIWVVVAQVAPELGEWAEYFAMLQLKVEAVQAGAVGLVTTREADDLVRDAQAFAVAAHA